MMECSLFVVVFGLVGLMAYLSQWRRSPFVWLVIVGLAGISGCIAFLMVPPQGVPAYIWPLGGMAVSAGLGALAVAAVQSMLRRATRSARSWGPDGR